MQQTTGFMGMIIGIYFLNLGKLILTWTNNLGGVTMDYESLIANLNEFDASELNDEQRIELTDALEDCVAYIKD